jgi:hypothetical protein
MAVRLRDHYFIAWLKVVKEKEIFIDENLNINIDITPGELKSLMEEYKTTLKPLLQGIRLTVKELNLTTTKPQGK